MRFTEAEIDELFRDIYADPLDPSELAELDRRTEGWAASLQLVEVSLREREGPVQRRSFIESITASSDSDLFAFLAEEVLDQQTDETRNFLLCTSILQQITPELAERMTGVRDGSYLLADLEQRGLFTNRLGDEEERYRYHGLFRDFLERRLVSERSEAEVVGLHIHAASYFETTFQWPQAIHHYLRAGLHRQAARLIARYGEGVVAEGRLGLIDEWLEQLPPKMILGNARLSLLHGEALGTIRGEWDSALGALLRGRRFFDRKGDRRMTALADLKLSTHYHYRGETERSHEAAQRGLSEANSDDYEIRLRLRGNVAITGTWLESLEKTERDCQELVIEATARGLAHFAATGHHNLGLVQRWLGRFTESLSNFEEANRFWGDIPSSPFGDNADFVETLLVLGDIPRAELAAQEGILRTRTWPRPHGEAEYGRACVLIQRGEFDEATRILRRLLAHREILGALAELVVTTLIAALYLAQSRKDDIEAASHVLARMRRDPRLSAPSATAIALAAHARNRCVGECTDALEQLGIWEAKGARFVAACGYVQVAPLRVEHEGKSGAAFALEALTAAEKLGAFPYLRWWLRRYGAISEVLVGEGTGHAVILRVAANDLDYWAPNLVSLLSSLPASSRSEALSLLSSHGTREIAQLLVGCEGADVALPVEQFCGGTQSVSISGPSGPWQFTGTIGTGRRFKSTRSACVYYLVS